MLKDTRGKCRSAKGYRNTKMYIHEFTNINTMMQFCFVPNLRENGFKQTLL